MVIIADYNETKNEKKKLKSMSVEQFLEWYLTLVLQ